MDDLSFINRRISDHHKFDRKLILPFCNAYVAVIAALSAMRTNTKIHLSLSLNHSSNVIIWLFADSHGLAGASSSGSL